MNKDTIEYKRRGYAFVALSRSHDRALSEYSWAKALDRWDYFPTKWDWVQEGLDLYDKLIINNSENYEEITSEVVKNMTSSHASRIVGKYTRSRATGSLLLPKYEPQDEWSYEAMQASSYTEQGFSRIENTELTKLNMARVRKKLNDEEYEALAAYVYGSHDSFKEAVDSIGYTHQQYDSVRRSIKVACKGMELAW